MKIKNVVTILVFTCKRSHINWGWGVYVCEWGGGGIEGLLKSGQKQSKGRRFILIQTVVCPL